MIYGDNTQFHLGNNDKKIIKSKIDVKEMEIQDKKMEKKCINLRKNIYLVFVVILFLSYLTFFLFYYILLWFILILFFTFTVILFYYLYFLFLSLTSLKKGK